MKFSETNVFIGLEVPLFEATQIALPYRQGYIYGPEMPDCLHVTLACVDSEIHGIQDVAEAVSVAVRIFRSANSGGLAVETNGMARFNTEEDKPDALVMLVGGSEIHALQDNVSRELARKGIVNTNTFEFLPHITLQYLSESDPLPVMRLATTTIEFDSVVVGNGDLCYRVPLQSNGYSLDIST